MTATEKWVQGFFNATCPRTAGFSSDKYISLKTLHGNEKYEIMAAFSTSVYTESGFSYYTFAAADEKQEYDTFVSECKERSLYETG